jgi:hypothetical protein
MSANHDQSFYRELLDISSRVSAKFGVRSDFLEFNAARLVGYAEQRCGIDATAICGSERPEHRAAKLEAETGAARPVFRSDMEALFSVEIQSAWHAAAAELARHSGTSTQEKLFDAGKLIGQVEQSNGKGFSELMNDVAGIQHAAQSGVDPQRKQFFSPKRFGEQLAEQSLRPERTWVSEFGNAVLQVPSTNPCRDLDMQPEPLDDEIRLAEANTRNETPQIEQVR